jgi:uncharacterized Zn finger protein (UPF0148 family)
MTANNTLQRTCDHCGCPVLATDGVLAGAECGRGAWPPT